MARRRPSSPRSPENPAACDRLSFALLQGPPLGWRSAGGAGRNHTGARRSYSPAEERQPNGGPLRSERVNHDELDTDCRDVRGSGTPCVLYGQTRTPKTHRLEATPATVAYGYYWSEAKPALRIASGDIIDVDTLLTNSPTGLPRAGVPDDKIQASLKAIHRGDRRSPRARRAHPDRAGLRRRRGARRHARGEDPVDRSRRSTTATTAAAASCRRTASEADSRRSSRSTARP